MNTETQFLIKIFPIRNCLIQMVNDDQMVEARPTILWMTQEVAAIIKIIHLRASSPRQAKAWSRNADEVLNRVYDLKAVIDEEVSALDEKSPYIQKHTGLYYSVICSILIADMHKTKLGKKILNDLMEASYSLEDIAVASNKKINGNSHDQIFDDAKVFVERIYKTMG